MAYKKGQITIFIILAVIIILLASSLILFKPNLLNILKNFNVQESLKLKAKSIDDSLNDCFNQRAIDAIRIAGLQGGYVNLPKNNVQTQFSRTAYGYFQGKNILPSKDKIQSEINSYIELTVPFCIDKDNYDFIINISNPIISSVVSKDYIKIRLKSSLTISNENESYYQKKEYEAKVNEKLGDMIDDANKIINEEIKNKGFLPSGYLSEIPYVSLVIYPNNQTVVIVLSDLKNNNETSYSFLFANDLGGIK